MSEIVRLDAVREESEAEEPVEGGAQGQRRWPRIAAIVLAAIGLVMITAGASYYLLVTNQLSSLLGTVYSQADLDEARAAAEDAGYGVGFQEGYAEGEADGFGAGEDAGYGRGEEAGYSAGYDAGDAQGYARGSAEGYDGGFAAGEGQGYDVGYAAGEQQGYSDGYAAGDVAGYNEGYDAGSSSGYLAGWSDGCESVFNGLGATRLVDYYDWYWGETYVTYLSVYEC